MKDGCLGRDGPPGRLECDVGHSKDHAVIMGFVRVMLKRVLVYCLGMAAVSVSCFSAEASMKISICPAITLDRKGDTEAFTRCFEDLFVDKTDQWQYVSENISHYKFYCTTLARLVHKNPELLRKVVRRISAMNLGIGIEVGIGRGHKPVLKSFVDPITKMGGRVDFLVTDNVFLKSQLRSKDKYGWTYEEAVEKYATFVAGVKKKYPKIKIGMIEAGFKYYWDDRHRFPPEKARSSHNLGDLKEVLLDVITACEKKGTKLDMFQPEYSYSRIENSKNGWEKLKAMEAFCREQGLDFIFLFNDHEGGRVSDKLFHEGVIRCFEKVREKGLRPKMGTIQSWYEHPVEELPEDKEYTFMHLAKKIIELNNKAEPENSDVIELHGKKNRVLRCTVISVGRDYARVKSAWSGKTGIVRFSKLSERSIRLLKQYE